MAANPLTIAQIRTFPTGSPVPMIQGTLIDVYEYRTGVGKHRSTVQSAMFSDTGGDKMRINIWNHPDMAARRGMPITIIAVTDKGKCSSKSIENTYHNPPSLELEVSKGSQILFSGSKAMETPPADHSENPDQTEEPSDATRQTRSQPVKRPVSGQNVGMCIKEAVGIVMKMEEAGNIEYVKSRQFSEDVFMIASDLMRISKLLEDGHKAPSAKERWYKLHPEDKPMPPTPPAAPTPPPAAPPPAAPPPAQPQFPPRDPERFTPPAPALPVKPARPGPDGSSVALDDDDPDVPF